MKAERLARFAAFARSFDCETHLIQPGLLAPPLVCGSLAWATAPEGVIGNIMDRDETRRQFRALIDDPGMILVGANIAYDMLVMAVDAARRGVDLMPAIFQAYEDGRVFDVQIAEALHAIACGHLGKRPDGSHIIGADGKITERYSLHTCVELVLGRSNAKESDAWRLSYALLEDIPLDQWPEEARKYPVDDAVNTLEVALAQVGARGAGEHTWGGDHGDTCTACGYELGFGAAPPCTAAAPSARRNLHDHAAQVYKAWCLHLGAAWGVRTDGASVDALESAARELAERGVDDFKRAGFLRDDGSEDTAVVKRAVALAYGCTGTCAACAGTGKIHTKFSKKDPTKPVGKPVNCAVCSATGFDLDTAAVPRTAPSTKFPAGQVQAGRDVLIESGDEFLAEYGYHQEDDKILSTYVPFLREGTNAPICLRPNAVLATGRVSYSGPIQLLPRQVSARLIALLLERQTGVYGVRDCIIPPGCGWVTVEVSDDYVLQAGEEWADDGA